MSTKGANNFRTTYLLMGGVAVLFVILAGYVFLGDEKKDINQDHLINSLGGNPQEINGLEIDRGDEKIVFTRQRDRRWRIVKPIEARADSTEVEAVIRQVLTAKREEKGADVKPDLAVHGLDKPAVKVTLRAGDKQATLSLGKVTVGGDQAVVYVLSSDDPKKAQAVRKSRLNALFVDKPAEDAGTAEMIYGVDHFRTRKLLGEGLEPSNSTAKIIGIKLTEKLPKGEKVVYVNRKPEGSAWHFEIPGGYGDVEMQAPDDKSNPSTIHVLPQLLNTALSIEVPEVKDYLPQERNLTSLGLEPNSPEVLRIDLEREDLDVETLWISKEEVKKEHDKVYARYEGDASVAQINGEKARMLRRFLDNPSTLRERVLVKLKQDRVDYVQITADGKTFELAKTERPRETEKKETVPKFAKTETDRWKVYEGDKVNNANANSLQELLLALSQPNAIRGFPPDKDTDLRLGFDKPAVEIKVWEDGVVAGTPEGVKPKLKGEPTAIIQFGKKDSGEIVYVRRYLGKAKADVYMSDSILALASRGRLDYVDIGLKQIPAAKVEKISFARGNEQYVIERSSKDGKLLDEWKILSPESKKGRLADSGKINGILFSFQELRPEKIVAEKPAPEQLSLLGLDPTKPRFKVVFKLKDESTERIVTFGNDLLKQPSVYTQISQCDFVFSSPKSRIDLFTQGEFVDPVVYRIEPVNVKVMRIKGWVDSSATGTPQTLELNRVAGGLWTPKGNLAITNSKVEDFLIAVSQPRRESIVSENAGPKPEHGLELAKGGLEIELELIEGKPITLTLGNLVKKDSKLLYAESNQAKGEVFTLDGEKLIPVKEKPAGFK